MGADAPISVEEFERMQFEDEARYELDEGELIAIAPGGEEHGSIAGTIHVLIGQYALSRQLGRVYSSDTTFVLAPGIARCPDVAFVLRDRQRTRNKRSSQCPPDLAVEVFSPSDAVPQLMRKVEQYLKAGCHTVWIVYPDEEIVHVRSKDGTDRILRSGDTLTAPELLPVFSLPVAQVFE